MWLRVPRFDCAQCTGLARIKNLHARFGEGFQVQMDEAFHDYD